MIPGPDLRPFAKDILQARLTSFATTIFPEKGDMKEFSINENSSKGWKSVNQDPLELISHIFLAFDRYTVYKLLDCVVTGCFMLKLPESRELMVVGPACE